uniref:uncharacterized protein LOC120339632 n=1 Tax=Styela clava TaxID=7725 RepID=UPI001939E6EC|nr:uncharacterized protein LOC120339632 [Styela clava]
MMHETITAWQMPNVRSPTESVDSGVELSPRTTSAYSSYDNDCSQIFTEIPCQGSPTYSSGSAGSVAEDSQQRYSTMSPEYTATYSPPLTEGELDALSDCSELTFSPCSAENTTELTEIGQFGFQPTNELAVQATGYHHPADVKAEGSVSLNTIKRKRRLKARQIGLCEAHPGVDPCLVPKSGTAKPRQSRKRKLDQKELPMAGGQGVTMNPKRCYSGARVKITAREKLQQLRRMQKNKGMLDTKPLISHSSGEYMSPSQQSGTSQIQAKVERQVATSQNEYGSPYSSMYATPQSSSCSVSSMSRSYYHSVEEILSNTALYNPTTSHHVRPEFQERKDNLDQIIEQIPMLQNITPLKEYIEQAMSSSNRTGQTPYHTILNKLNQKTEIYNVQQIKQVMEQVCRVLPGVINRTNLKGETPIYLASLYGNIGAVQALMEAGADPWIQEKSGGETALIAAVKSRNASTVAMILSKREDPKRYVGINATSYDGNTALHRATALRDVDLAVQKQIVINLLEANADASIKNNMSQMAHSFLPDQLKELQADMKKLNGRKRAQAHQIMSPLHAEGAVYGRSFNSQYSHVTPEMLHAHLTRPSSSYTSQHARLSYSSYPQPPKTFAPSTTMSFGQLNAFATGQIQHPALPPYVQRTPQIPTTEHLPQDVVDEFFQNLPEVPPEA